MKQEFSLIEAGSHILLNLSAGNNSMEMGATIVKHLKENMESNLHDLELDKEILNFTPKA